MLYCSSSTAPGLLWEVELLVPALLGKLQSDFGDGRAALLFSHFLYRPGTSKAPGAWETLMVNLHNTIR